MGGGWNNYIDIVVGGDGLLSAGCYRISNLAWAELINQLLLKRKSRLLSEANHRVIWVVTDTQIERLGYDPKTWLNQIKIDT